MNVLQKLNSSGSDKPYHGFTVLSRGFHEILAFRESHGKYGKGVICELNSEIIYLPQYLVEKLDGNDIEELNKCTEKLYLFFGGLHKKKK